MLLNSELLNEKSARLLKHYDTTSENQISDYYKLELINKAILDRRLGASDTKVYTFLINFGENNYSQEEIACELGITRMSVSKSINKLIAFNYISMEKQFAEVSNYSIINFKDAGICRTDIDNLVKIFNLDTKPEYRFSYHSEDPELEIDNLKLEWRNFEQNLKDKDIDISSDTIKSILKDDNCKLVLFIANSNNKVIMAFREKYFESLVRFYNKFAGLWDENFFFIYYKIISNKLYRIKSDKNYGYPIEDIMIYANIPHSSDIRVSNKFRTEMSSKTDTFVSNYIKLLETIDIHSIELPENIYNIARRINFKSKLFSIEELIVIVIIGDFINKFEEKTGLLFHKLLECIDRELLEDYILFMKEKQVFR